MVEGLVAGGWQWARTRIAYKMYSGSVQRKGSVPRYCPHLSVGEVAAAILRTSHQVASIFTIKQAIL